MLDLVKLVKDCTESRPSRGAWIEIQYLKLSELDEEVAPLAGRVD